MQLLLQRQPPLGPRFRGDERLNLRERKPLYTARYPPSAMTIELVT